MDYRVFNEQRPDEIHYWHRARLRLIDGLFGRILQGRSNLRVLDVGCGTGSELPLLSTYGQVTALDVDERALSEVKKKGYETIVGDASSVGVISSTYDVVCAFDVLEHINDDRAAMRAIYKALGSGDSFLVTVPAYQWLYSEHDTALGHFRRYSKKELLTKLRDAGFVIRYMRYWNTLLFPVAALLRFFKKTKNVEQTGLPVSEAASCGPLIDSSLYFILSQEARGILSWLRFFNVGLSIAVIAQKP